MSKFDSRTNISSNAARSAQRGFTLIELLVVAATALIIMAMLLPYLWWAKEEADRTVCQSNHRQLNTAYLQYATDNRGILVCPAPGVPAPGYGGPWVNGAVSTSDGNDYFAIASGALFPYVNAGADPMAGQPVSTTLIAAIDANPPRAVKAYVCPSDWVRKNTRTYSVNGWLDDPAGICYSGDQITRLSQVKRPSSTFTFIDEYDDRGYNEGGFEELSPYQTNILPIAPYPPLRWIWVDVPGLFHLDGNNISFIDGHVEWWQWGDPRTLALPPGSAGAVPLTYGFAPNNMDLYRLQSMRGDIN
jgi:prepilin-type N-terminal cleavage/methylation domain-containing protein/prepilin-type processing-associated H-X9-DG protein